MVDNNTVRRRKRGRSVPDLSAGFDVRQFAPTEFSRGDLSPSFGRKPFSRREVFVFNVFTGMIFDSGRKTCSR